MPNKSPRTEAQRQAARERALAQHAKPKIEKTQEEIDEHRRMREPDPKFDAFFEELMNPFSKLNIEIANEKTFKPGEPGYIDPTVDAVTGRKFSEIALEEARALKAESKDDSDYERAYLEAIAPKSVSGPSRK